MSSSDWSKRYRVVRRRTALVCALTGAFILAPATPAAADNCSGLSDCSWAIKVALALLAIALAIALWYAFAPLIAEMIAASAARSALAESILAAVRANTMRHIFGKAAHNLASLVARMGSERAVMAAVARALAGLSAGTLPAAGTFEVIVRVGGQNVTVRGAVVDGIVRISTMFIP
jgi:hypothetical protein